MLLPPVTEETLCGTGQAWCSSPARLAPSASPASLSHQGKDELTLEPPRAQAPLCRTMPSCSDHAMGHTCWGKEFHPPVPVEGPAGSFRDTGSFRIRARSPDPLLALRDSSIYLHLLRPSAAPMKPWFRSGPRGLAYSVVTFIIWKAGRNPALLKILSVTAGDSK